MREIRLAKVSLYIVLIFILCHSVKWIPNMYELIHFETLWSNFKFPLWLEWVKSCNNLVTTLNASVNVYIYHIMHTNIFSWFDCRRQCTTMRRTTLQQCAATMCSCSCCLAVRHHEEHHDRNKMQDVDVTVAAGVVATYDAPPTSSTQASTQTPMAPSVVKSSPTHSNIEEEENGYEE